jgi:hypothetical protein
MSQWNNRFHVLDSQTSEEEKIPSASDTKPETMSANSLYPPTVPPPEPSLFPERVYIRTAYPKTSTQLPVVLRTLDTGTRLSVTALLDSGATGLFLDS